LQASLYHVQLNVGDAARSLPFYRALFDHFEYRVLCETRELLGVTNGTTDIWLVETPSERRHTRFHRKNVGVNHLAFGVRRREDVDAFVGEFLQPRGLAPLYGSPREYPEYRAGYYAVFFEDPDRLKLEVAHVPGITNPDPRGAPSGER
jgi:catechol 2,3-dioxygenase-like lactoylglutathione lyase family enzyme